MYGQTNCYVLPDGDYGAFRQANGDVFVTSKRAAVGLAHQGAFTPVENGPDDFSGYAETWGEADLVGAMFKGADLLGCPLKAPLAKYDVVYTLPLTTISMTKGTGVVTSVPSDAPDDWIALHELKNDPKLRETWGLEEKHVAFDVVPIINITVGASGEGKAKKEAWASDVSAEYWCEKLDIKSQKDAAKLKVAKGETYLNGFNYGVMLVGPHAGTKVADAKPVVKGELVASGDALLYFEPESPIISRSGEECIVAHTEQWSPWQRGSRLPTRRGRDLGTPRRRVRRGVAADARLSEETEARRRLNDADPLRREGSATRISQRRRVRGDAATTRISQRRGSRGDAATTRISQRRGSPRRRRDDADLSEGDGHG